MTSPFTAAQFSEIDDRIVEMIAAALGEGAQARRARAIANERWLELESQPEPPAPRVMASTLQPIASAPRDAFILAHCPDVSRCETWPMAPWIMAKWNRDTDCWRDQQGIEVAPTHWLPLDTIDLRPLPPEGSGELKVGSDLRMRLLELALTSKVDDPVRSAKTWEIYVSGETITAALNADA